MQSLWGPVQLQRYMSQSKTPQPSPSSCMPLELGGRVPPRRPGLTLPGPREDGRYQLEPACHRPDPESPKPAAPAAESGHIGPCPRDPQRGPSWPLIPPPRTLGPPCDPGTSPTPGPWHTHAQNGCHGYLCTPWSARGQMMICI